MPFDEFKYRVIAGLFDMAGNFISGHITKPTYEDHEKITDEYYDKMKQVARETDKRADRERRRIIEEPVEQEEQARDTEAHGLQEKRDLTQPKIEGGTACLPCIPPNSKIYTPDGSRTISKIKIGDYALDKLGKWTKVTKIFNNQYTGTIYDIHIQYQNIPITVTPEHPLLASSNGGKTEYILPKNINEYVSYLAYPRIKETKKIEYVFLSHYTSTKDYCLIGDKIQLISKNTYKNITRTQRVGKPVRNRIKLTNNLMRLFGFYLAEGHVTQWKRGKGIRFSFGKHEKEYISFIAKTLEESFDVRPRIVNKRTGINVEIYSEMLSNLFLKLFGKNSHTKKIPEWFLTLPIEKQKYLLKGYYQGDGYIRKGKYNNISCTTVSKSLIISLRNILARLGIIASYSIKTQEDTKIKERTIKSNGERHILDCWGKSGAELICIVDSKKLKKEFEISHGALIDSNYIYYPVKKITERQYNGRIMNISTESNSYVVNGVITHNCSRDHFSTVSGALTEAIRFSRREGVQHKEVQRRLGMSLDELNMLERIDLSPEETVRLKGKEKHLAEWGLNKSRELRHKITAVQNHEDLERVAAMASQIRTEFMRNLWDIATVDGSIQKLCKGLKDEEYQRCVSTINEILVDKKETPP